MGKTKTLSFVLEMELITDSYQRKYIDKRMDIGINIYNACLGKCMKLLRTLMSDKEYRELVRNKNIKNRNQKLKEIERFYEYSEYQLHHWAIPCCKHFNGMVQAQEVQKIVTRAFRTAEKYHYCKAKKVHFKKKGEDMSIEGKSNRQGLRWNGEKIIWGKIKFNVKTDKNDKYIIEGLKSRTKYVRILRKEIRGKERYFVQLIQEGNPPKKKSQVKLNKNKRVGIDIGTSTVAIASDDIVLLKELAPEINDDEKKIRRLNRAMERSRRVNNPDNYKENGTVRKDAKKWNYSKKYLKLKSRRLNMYRKVAEKRKQSHEILANQILSLGDDIRVEAMRFQSLQKKSNKISKNKKNGKINSKKRFGKSIKNHAPSMLLNIIDRKLGYQGEKIKKIDTYKTKASQFNHITGEYSKKQLNERWNNDLGGYRIQRDLYSAFLIKNTNDKLDEVNVNLCDREWKQFVELHDYEIDDLKRSCSKTLRWFIA